MPLRYGSVCSGIEAATVAWHPLGMRAAWFAEIEPFPSAVLAHHYPEIPNHGDFTRLVKERPAAVDVLVGGTPCQAFSVAGLRGGLADPRGNLALAFVALVDALRPRWVVWENVPGVLSSGGGRDFGSFLGALGELGYGWAYRVLDAQYFGLAQRRQRVFVVASPGDWRGPAAVLFEPESVRRDSPPRRQAGAGVAGSLGSGASDGRGWRVGADEAAGGQVVPAGLDDGALARSLNAHPSRSDYETETLIAHTLRAESHDASEDGTGRGVPLVPVAFDTTQITSRENRSNPKAGDPCHPLAAGAHVPAVAFGTRRGVRRLMPHELERLQGFPDGYTLIPRQQRKAIEDDYAAWYAARYPDASREEIERFAKDGPRAKALGNSMAVPVMRWIGRRVLTVDAIARSLLVAPDVAAVAK
jgi:DNA (cytosine-5)-methyltransferase 1